MISRNPPAVRRGAAAVLVALAVLIAWSSFAGRAGASGARSATPGQENPPANGTCQRIVRDRYRPVETIRSPGDQLNDHGDLPPFEGFTPDARFWTTYCWQSSTSPPSWTGEWTLSEDAFPYDSPDECVTLRLGANSGAGAPAEIARLDDIDQYGRVYNGADPPDGDGYQRYCRNGSKWVATVAPGPGQGECRRVLRWTYKPTETLPGDKEPEDYGFESSIVVDGRFWTTYCFSDGRWRLTEDAFPYDSPRECVQIFYNPEGQPPDRIDTLGRIDDYGTIDPRGGVTGDSAGNRETYCSDGDKWVREARSDDYPSGDYQDWSEECVTIYPDNDTPRRITRNPRELGRDVKERDFPLGHVNVSDFVTYCRKGDVWYQVDNYPLEEALTEEQRERLRQPENGTCVVMAQVPPEVLPRLASPYDYGAFLPLDLWKQGRDEEPPADKLLCYVAGAWRRGDNLDDVCALDAGREPEDRGDDLGTVYLIPDGCWGRYPTSQYDIGYDSGAWNHFERKVTGWWTGLFYDLGKGATQVTLWAVGWAYDFDISRYNQLGLQMGSDYQHNLLNNPAFRLLELVWLALVGWAGVTALRGKIAMAGGEILMSIVLLALSTVLIANRAEYMSSAWRLMDEASAALLVAGQGEQSPGRVNAGSNDTCLAVNTTKPESDDGRARAAAAVRDMQRQIHCVFVEQPYDYLNWGRPLTGECAAVRNQILARGPHEADDEPRDMMNDHGPCRRLAEYNAQPTGGRLLGALLTMAASFVMAFTMLALALTVIVCKLVALLLFALAPFAALAGTLPAGLRRIAWLWVTTLFQVIAAVIGMSFLLSVLLLGLSRLFEATTDVALIERFFIMNLLVLVVALGRKRMLAGGAASAGRLADNLTNFRLGGGGAPWEGPRGTQGVNLLNVDRGLDGTRARVGRAMHLGAIYGGMAVAAPFTMLGRSVILRARERRMARRNYRNLEKIEHWRRGLHEPQYTETWRLMPNSGGGGSSGPPPSAPPPASLPPTRPRPGGPSGGRPGGGGAALPSPPALTAGGSAAPTRGAIGPAGSPGGSPSGPGAGGPPTSPPAGGRGQGPSTGPQSSAGAPGITRRELLTGRGLSSASGAPAGGGAPRPSGGAPPPSSGGAVRPSGGAPPPSGGAPAGRPPAGQGTAATPVRPSSPPAPQQGHGSASGPGQRSSREEPGAPFPAPEGYHWERQLDITTTGRLPGMNPNPTHHLPQGPLERVLHGITRGKEQAQDEIRGVRDAERIRQTRDNLREWGRDHDPGDWP